MQNEPASVILSDEVAQLLNRDRSTVTRQAAQGKLPTVRKLDGIRGAYLFDRAEIERLAAEERQKLQRRLDSLASTS